MLNSYDVALKLLLRTSTSSVLRQLTGSDIARWLNVEFPQIQNTRVDLLGVTAHGGLIHIELQSSNDANMALRMAEYALRIYRQYKIFPTQILLYIGQSALTMPNLWKEPNPATPTFTFHYSQVDVRDLDTAALLASSHIEDNLLAILTRLQDQLSTVREILGRIANLDEPQRTAAFEQFLIISELRKLAPTIHEETKKVPILNDILEHQVIGPAILKGRAEGRAEGANGTKIEMILRLLRSKFGTLPTWVEPSLSRASSSDLDAIFDQALNATTFDQLTLLKP